ncbi:MAG: septal ring lytic transglycosylase RlpA family protein [Patescibacteria group bacterium]
MRMLWKAPRVLFVLAMLIVSCLVFGHTTHAAEVTESHIFYLDWGFVGHPVSLDINSKTRVSWDAGDLNGQTTLLVEIEKGDTGDVVHITWADPYLLSSRGVMVTDPTCKTDGWTQCSLERLDGATWVPAKDNRAYGHVRVRMATSKAAYMQSGSASWYKYKNCLCAASVDFPKGTRLRVTSVANPTKKVIIRVNDYGPERDKFPERAIDLDAVAFKALAPLGAGVINVRVEPVAPTDPDYVLADILVAPVTPIVTAPKPASVVVAPEPTWSY